MGLNTPGSFSFILSREATFVTSCLSIHQPLLSKGLFHMIQLTYWDLFSMKSIFLDVICWNFAQQGLLAWWICFHGLVVTGWQIQYSIIWWCMTSLFIDYFSEQIRLKIYSYEMPRLIFHEKYLFLCHLLQILLSRINWLYGYVVMGWLLLDGKCSTPSFCGTGGVRRNLSHLWRPDTLSGRVYCSNCLWSLLKRMSTLKGKNLPPWGAKSILTELSPLKVYQFTLR